MLRLLPKHGIVAELGVAAGDFSRQIFDVCQPTELHLIDVWGSERYGETLYSKVKAQFSTNQSPARPVVSIHRQTSLDAQQQFPYDYFYWIYIDTIHSYELTRDELRGYANKNKPNGIIVGHDYMQGNWRSQLCYGVIEAVHEFCVEYNYRFRYLTMDISESLSFAIEKFLTQSIHTKLYLIRSPTDYYF